MCGQMINGKAPYATHFGNNCCFDGSNLWITIPGSNLIYKIRCSDGAILGSVSTGTYPINCCYDSNTGTLLVLNNNNNNQASITFITASSMAVAGTYTLPASTDKQCYGITSDGTYVYPCSGVSGNLYKIIISNRLLDDGETIAGYAAAVYYDSYNNYLWVSLPGGGDPNSLARVNVSNLSIMTTFNIGSNPYIENCMLLNNVLWCFVNRATNNLVSISSSGSVINQYTIGSSALLCGATDGTYIYTTPFTSTGTIYKVNASNGNLTATFTLPNNLGNFSFCKNIIYDGTYLWAVNSAGVAATQLDVNGNVIRTINL